MCGKENGKRGRDQLTVIFFCCESCMHFELRPQQRRQKNGYDLLSAVRIGLESTLPDAEGHLDTAIISKVLAECQLSIHVVVFVTRPFDSKVAVLLDKAL